ncbi:MAG: type II toxin-antitoxin system VapC family toxin [Rhizonema sp. PD38]|nr:type II toxin-antitoxin system VapC family toxin [Rhizonema sp. PD38]
MYARVLPTRCANVLWKQVRFQGMSQTEADQLLVELLALPFDIMPVGNILPRALQIGLSNQLAIYDSFYIALAETLSCPLITVDRRQAEAATASNVVIKPITDFV